VSEELRSRFRLGSFHANRSASLDIRSAPFDGKERMATLLIVGGGLFGSVAAAYARSKGIETTVFDAQFDGAASPAGAGLFTERWAGKKLREHYLRALPLLDRLYGLREVVLRDDAGRVEQLHHISPSVILEPAPVREHVTAVGDGWLVAGGCRYKGWIYLAAGIWCQRFVPDLGLYGKAGAAFTFMGERAGRMRALGHGHQVVAFVRDPGATYLSDGTAEREYTVEHDRQTLARAAELGLTEPAQRFWGYRPYALGGLLFRRLGSRTWLATGGRKMGTILGASCAGRLVEDELRL
jgi:hypothetical protein